MSTCFRRLPVVLVTLVIAGLCIQGGDALLTEVNAGQIFVVTEVVPPETALIFQFNVPTGEFPVQVSVHDTAGTVLRQWTESMEGSFVLEASNKVQMVEVHFDNTASMMSHATVNFYFRQNVDYHFAATKTDLDPIEQKVAALSLAMQRLQGAQVNLRQYEKDHRSTVEDSNTRVLLWAVLQVITLMAVSLVQLYLLKRFLERKTVI